MRILIATILALAIPASAGAAVDAVPGQLIVKLRHGRTELRHVPLKTNLRHAARALEHDPRVEWAQPNVYQRGAALPDDALYGQQWSLPAIGAPAAWDHTTGSDAVRVAIVDSGINLDEPDLAPNVRADLGWDFVQDDADASDNVGHGTHVAGIVAARGDNAIGISGVAWRASLIPVRVLDNMNVGTCLQITQGMAYAVQQGARVVNLSLGSTTACQPERDVIDGAPDVLFVVAAMNDSEDVDPAGSYPCSYPSPNIICVAATDEHDQLASFSNYGAHDVDLAAPGDNILSSFVQWGPKQVLSNEGFESPLSGDWVTGGSPDTWGRSFTYWHSGSWSLSDSPSGQYADNTDSYAALTGGLDLTGRRDCAASVYARTALSDDDALLALTSPDQQTWGRRITALTGTSNGFERWLIDLSELEGHAGGGLAFRLISNASGTDEGVALDDLEVFCVPPITNLTGAADEFEIDWGTSMATPHVTGVAALLLSLAPELTAAQLKQVILATVDPLPSLAGRTATGGRLDAAGAVGLVAEALTQASGSSSPPPPGAPPSTTPATDVSKQLAADLGASLRGLRLRTLVRTRRLTVRLHHAYPPGRFGLVVRTGRRTVARGRSLTATVTRAGARRLRHLRRARLQVALTFTPRAGDPVVAARTVVARR
jgi:subtilisin family serine protease